MTAITTITAAGNILLIDDEEKLRSLLSRIIRLEGCTIFEAGDLKAGMKTLEKESIDVVHLGSVEKLHILRVLHHTNGNKTETARLLNIGLTTLYRKIEEYKL